MGEEIKEEKDPLSREPQEKTPVGVLQECCQKKGLTPCYEVTAEAPYFEFRVVIEDFIASGRGRKKKLAKQTAARALLLQIVDSDKHVDWNIPGATKQEARDYVMGLLNLGEEAVAGGSGDGEDGQAPQNENTINVLLEHVRKQKLPIPEFDEKPVSEGIFGCTCKCGLLETFAEGRSKKGAKRDAARKMTKILKEQEEVRMNDDEFEGIETGSAYPKEMEKELAALAPSEREEKKEAQLYDDLLSLNLNKEPEEKMMRILSDISKEDSGCEPAYHNLTYRSKNGLYQCLIQLQTSPVAVCYGEGLTREQAKWSAAQNALKYLKAGEERIALENARNLESMMKG